MPTPWRKAEFEAYEHDIQAERRQIRNENRPESEMNALFEKEKKHEDELLATDKYSDRVGAFEGANYEAHGYYRPQENCIMFTPLRQILRRLPPRHRADRQHVCEQ